MARILPGVAISGNGNHFILAAHSCSSKVLSLI